MSEVPIAWLSPSGQTKWRQCRRSWRHRYVDHFADPSGTAAVIGTFVHRTLELFYRDAPADRTRRQAKAWAREAWAETEASDDYQALMATPRETYTMKMAGWKAIERLWKIENPEEQAVRATERRLKLELGGTPFSGIIDRVDANGDIIDYKTGKVPAPWFLDYNALLLYAAAAQAADGGPLAERAWFFYLKPGQTKSIDVHPVTVKQAVDGLARDWHDIGEACATETFPATTSPLCNWCPYSPFCAEGTEYIARMAAEKVTKAATKAAAQAQPELA